MRSKLRQNAAAKSKLTAIKPFMYYFGFGIEFDGAGSTYMAKALKKVAAFTTLENTTLEYLGEMQLQFAQNPAFELPLPMSRELLRSNEPWVRSFLISARRAPHFNFIRTDIRRKVISRLKHKR